MSSVEHRYVVLILEDDLDLAKQWQRALESEGMHVSVASAVDSAVFYCKDRQFDIIIVDLFLRRPNDSIIPYGGLTLIGYLRSRLKGLPEWGRSVPIIAVSGAVKQNGYDALLSAEMQGANSSLRKPFRVKDLVAEVYFHLKVSNKPEDDD